MTVFMPYREMGFEGTYKFTTDSKQTSIFKTVIKEIVTQQNCFFFYIS